MGRPQAAAGKDGISMKIAIVGAGKVGTALTRHLSVDNKVTVIDQNPHLVDNIINIYDVMGVCGNGASYDVQKEADVQHTDLLIATTSSDEINILTCLVAKKLGVQHTIARVRNPEYGRQLRFMRGELGLSMAINPEQATAREIARVLRFPTAMKLESFSKGRLELVEYRVAEHTALDGTQLSELYRSFKVRVLICAVARQGETIIPSGDFTLRAGDFAAEELSLIQRIFARSNLREREVSMLITCAISCNNTAYSSSRVSSAHSTGLSAMYAVPPSSYTPVLSPPSTTQKSLLQFKASAAAVTAAYIRG